MIFFMWMITLSMCTKWKQTKILMIRFQRWNFDPLTICSSALINFSQMLYVITSVAMLEQDFVVRCVSHQRFGERFCATERTWLMEGGPWRLYLRSAALHIIARIILHLLPTPKHHLHLPVSWVSYHNNNIASHRFFIFVCHSAGPIQIQCQLKLIHVTRVLIRAPQGTHKQAPHVVKPEP